MFATTQLLESEGVPKVGLVHRRASSSADGNTGLPVLLALSAGLAAFFWWKRSQSKDGSKGSRSPFKFPGGKATPAAAAAAAAPTSLPRNKTSNNKKNKARKKDKEQKKAEKKEA